MKKLKSKINDYGATLLGIIVASANALYTIDWVNFDIHKEWPKLVFSVIIAAGGYVSKIKGKNEGLQE